MAAVLSFPAATLLVYSIEFGRPPGVSGIASVVLGQNVGAVPVKETTNDGPRTTTDTDQLKFYGSASCLPCHESPRAFKNRTDFVTLTEYHTWKTRDKHSQAYCVLETPASEQMGKLLGWKPGEVATRRECLSCHAVNDPAFIPKPRQGDGFNIRDGVSCDGCHGPAQLWFGEHTQIAWRQKSAQEKQQKWGMIDVRDPVARTKMCAACHIGNVREGKIVTHAMYAAGHPPLPGFEVSFFSDSMPRHWRYLSEKPAGIQKQFGFDSDQLMRTKLVIIGGAVALAQTLEVLAAQTAPEVKQTDGQWPELAQFDCYACHHDLKTGDPQQHRSEYGPPGRPRMRNWPIGLAKLAAAFAGRDKLRQFNQQLARLRDAFHRQPYGNRQMIAKTAAEFARWANDLSSELNDRKYDQAAAERSLRAIALLAKTEAGDFDSARQLGWAFKTIYEEAISKTDRDAEIVAAIRNLDTSLGLTLPAREAISISDQAGKSQQCADQSVGVILKQLPVSMTKAADFSPKKVRRAFETIQGRLKSVR